jgi:glucosylglycerate synthase
VAVHAPTEQSARRLDPLEHAELVVGVYGQGELADAAETAERARTELDAAEGVGRAAVLLLSGDAAHVVSARVDGDAGPDGPLAFHTWRVEPREGPLEALLRAGEALDTRACALLRAGRDDLDGEALRHLVRPVLEEGFDLVCPVYFRHKYEAALNTGIAYPFTRALFGKRLRRPVCTELAVSRKLAQHLLGDELWRRDPAEAGHDLWLLTQALAGGFQVSQSVLGPPPPLFTDRAELGETLVRVVGLLFHEARRHAPVWQRVRGSQGVPTFGALPPMQADPRPLDVSRLVDAFALGYRDLHRLWSAVLSPGTLLTLKRLAAAPADAFRMDDTLWARIVYEFAVGYHTRAMERGALLRSMAPLYLGGRASFMNEVRELESAAVDQRVEVLCSVFEAQKPYLIQRWRWPDRFAP